MLSRRRAIAALLVLGSLVSTIAPARAETTEIRIAQQFGISYLPLIVMKEQHLLEQAVVEAGLPRPTVTWAQFSGAAAMNDALISGNLDVATAGVGPMIIVWARTRASLKITGVAALGAMPNLLTTSNPRIRTLADFTDKDRIALPAVKIGAQAVMLQMAAEQAFGPGQQNKLDDITVSMAHPDAAAALLGGSSEIDAHFTSPPFSDQELANPKIHKVWSNYDQMGGPATFNVLYAPEKFHAANPQSYGALLVALDRAMAVIKADPTAAAALYIKSEGSKLTPAFVEGIIRDPANDFTATPLQTLKTARFLFKTGAVKVEAAKWQDLFFPEIAGRPGS
ncbi:MAG TPA: ABC transporter substrate-binding protein [Aliidongia sp.]|uniref:ABC transporter substrate-binding protein n=1 Tax=Aliidongia sp. TaxID=1914230 RepID=UPI002DDD55C3|nr:ABC transporter substrate-binding protein [Aliidongia sp.]HEV2675003.1 ABC transporter substrate-binding protein [Aliidongia sp.]